MQSLASVKETAKHSPWYLALFFIKASIHHYLKYLTWTAFICFFFFFCGVFLLFFSIKFNSVKILILFVFSYYPQHLEKYLAQEVFVEWMRFLDILPDVFLYIYIHMATQKEIKFYKNGIILSTYSSGIFLHLLQMHRHLSVPITVGHYYILKLLQIIPSCLSQAWWKSQGPH